MERTDDTPEGATAPDGLPAPFDGRGPRQGAEEDPQVPGFVRLEAVVDQHVVLAELRVFVRNAVELLGIGPFDDLDLLAHELVKNALALDEASVRISVQRVGPRGVRVEVRDYGYGLPLLVEEPIRVGLGLAIVDRLADDWGVDQFLPGKIVWFQLSGPSSTSPTSGGRTP